MCVCVCERERERERERECVCGKKERRKGIRKKERKNTFKRLKVSANFLWANEDKEGKKEGKK